MLRPSSFGLPEGMVGIAGQDPSGRSDLLATLATLRRPHAGRLEVLGFDVRNRATLRRLRTRIGFLPARARWAAGFTVHDLVSYAAYYQRRSPSSVRDVLTALELSDAAAWPYGELPADLRVRAGLAAACVHRPQIAFLDEPLTLLGDAARAELVPLLAGLAPTVVLTAPSAAWLTPWCDHVYVLERARLVPAGETAPLAAPPARELPEPEPHHGHWHLVRRPQRMIRRPQNMNMVRRAAVP
ncbi:ATP-binding cassette domain-containing protein [Actinocorallia populi]|uniref:ATP-binding cassette domain-containing protein n=1 Tax=Actinocorallia populi TaxID=2079200 RepID=UPI0018E5A1D7|nr:ATP-binding cassette domain-containing protein [Actinocorallia populi]